MESVRVPIEEQELTINYFPKAASALMNVYSCIPHETRYLRNLALEHPNEVRIIREDASGIDVELPASWYRRPKPPCKRNFTEEQRAVQAERMRAIRTGKGGE